LSFNSFIMVLKKRLILLILIIIVSGTALYASNNGTAELIKSENRFILWAFILGGLSAISLVIGSVLGIVWKPSARITAAFTAFGAGALLAALSVELIAPTVIEFVENSNSNTQQEKGHDMLLEFVFLISGCIAGGIIFYLLNEALNSSGGYLRKVSTTLSHFRHIRNKRYRKVIRRLSKIKLFRSIPASHLDVLIQHIRQIHIKKGNYLFRQGDKLQQIYFLESGEIEACNNGKIEEVIVHGNVIGETSFLSQHPALYEAKARTDLKLLVLTYQDFNHIHDSCPELQEILEEFSHQELMHDMEKQTVIEDNHTKASNWENEAYQHVHTSHVAPTQKEINESAKKHSSAPLSIWLGIFLDGIPESFVIGAGFLMILSSKASLVDISLTEVIPYTLIAGLFLSNLPEAMSSSIGMKKMGWKAPKILLLWTSLMVMTALGAIVGYYYGLVIPNYFKIGIEGLAAGAMLTMIAQTMIPEAVHIGGSRITGLSTLAGYLAAVAFKIFE